MAKIDNLEIETEALLLIETAGQPVSVDWMAYHLGVGWGTARSLLLNLALKGEIKAVKTSKSFIFLPRGKSL